MPHSEEMIGSQRKSEVEATESLRLQQESLARESRSKRGRREWSKTESGTDSNEVSVAIATKNCPQLETPPKNARNWRHKT
jgi:hypothetical protein